MSGLAKISYLLSAYGGLFYLLWKTAELIPTP